MEITGERTMGNQSNIYEFKRVYDLVSNLYGNRDKIVLDYGCGSGYSSFILSRNFYKVIGIDVNNEAIIFCRENYTAPNLQFSVFDPAKKPFKDEYFDYIFSFQVLEHIPLDLTKVYIHNIWQMLKPGGVGIITTPNSNNYYGGFSGNPFHVKEYSYSELESIFQNSIPSNRFNIFAVEDVFSTKVRIMLKRSLKIQNSLFSKILDKAVERPLKMLELIGIVSTDYQKMLKKNNPEKVTGSYDIEIKK